MAARDCAAALRSLKNLHLVANTGGRLGWTRAVPAHLGARLIALRDSAGRDLIRVPFAEDCPVSIVAVPNGGEHLPSYLSLWGGAASAAMSIEDAAVSCLFEVAERCSQMRDGSEPVVSTSAKELGVEAIDPGELVPLSRSKGRAADILGSEPIDWTSARRLDGEACWIPTDHCFRSSSPRKSAWSWPGESNGAATGISLGDATLRGLLEVVERDAVAIWWFNRVRRPPLRISMMDMPTIAPVARWLRTNRRRMHFLDITSDLGIPVVAAVSFHESGSGIALGFAADLDRERAAIRAMLEMMQFHAMVNLSLMRHPSSDDGELEQHTETARNWFLSARIVDEPYLLPDAEASYSPLTIASTEPSLALESCVAALGRHGFRPLVVDLSRPWIGIPAVKVIVPGLRSLKRFFGPGRLYDVPVSMGWHCKRCREDELNPRNLPT